MESDEKELLIFIDGNSSKLKEKANNSLYDLFKEYLRKDPRLKYLKLTYKMCVQSFIKID